MGLEQDKREEAGDSGIKGTLSAPASDKYPAEDTETFKKLFDALCSHFKLENPVDQMLANRAATQLMLLQFCQKQLQKHGMFSLHVGRDKKENLLINPLCYVLKQIEGEFRAYIRMLRQQSPKGNDDGVEDFSDWIQTTTEKKKKK